MNPAIYAKALTGGATAGAGYVIVGWLVSLAAHGIDAIGIAWLTMPLNVQEAIAALIVSGLSGLVVYHTANAPAETPAPTPVATETKP